MNCSISLFLGSLAKGYTMMGSLLFKWIGIILTAIGTVSLFSCYTILSFFMNREMSLSPSSKSYEIWKKPPLPIVMNIYLFNCTNPDQIFEKNYKPEFTQMGPYSFNEVQEKVDITWNPNHTVTYQQVRRWNFDQENSNGSLNANVTTLNIVLVGTSFVTRNWNSLLIYLLSFARQMFGKSIWVTKPVSELLFDGFTDPLLSVASKFPALLPLKLPGNRFGFLYGRNDSFFFDGVFNVETGTDDITKRGIIRNWNYKNHTLNDGYYAELRGSTGEFFPPVQSKHTNLELFISEFCRTVQLEFLDEVTVSGLTGYRYVMSKYFVDNGTSDPGTVCKFQEDSLPQGVFNLTSCRRGAPLYISNPHFFNADPCYVSQISGMQPEAEKHQFYVTLEPITGIPLQYTARFQLNVLLQSNSRFRMFAGLPPILFPVLWLDIRISITPEFATILWIILHLHTISAICSVVLLLTGLLTLGLTFRHQIVRAVLKINMVTRRYRIEDYGIMMHQAKKQTPHEENITLLHTEH